MKYNTILFDLDGTLTDPGMGITNSVMYALKKFGITVNENKELFKFIGPPLDESFEKFYGFSKEQATLAVKYFREFFRETGISQNEIYDGVEKLLIDLKEQGKTLVLATSKPEEFAKIILETFHIDKYFTVIAGATFDGTRSKKGDVIKYALNLLGDQTDLPMVMVGDRLHDINGAKENNLDSIGVLFGYGDREELEKARATYIVRTPKEIGELIFKLSEN